MNAAIRAVNSAWLGPPGVHASVYVRTSHGGSSNPCRANREDYCCDSSCTYCGPQDYCETESPFQAHSGVCNPDYHGAVCANYYVLQDLPPTSSRRRRSSSYSSYSSSYSSYAGEREEEDLWNLLEGASGILFLLYILFALVIAFFPCIVFCCAHQQCITERKAKGETPTCCAWAVCTIIFILTVSAPCSEIFAQAQNRILTAVGCVHRSSPGSASELPGSSFPSS